MTDADKKLFDDYNNYIGYSQKFESRICETDKNLCNVIFVRHMLQIFI